MRRSAVLAPLLGLILAACGGAASPSPSPSASPTAPPDPSPSASPSSSPSASDTETAVWLPEWSEPEAVPDSVANRRPLRFCGVEEAPAPQPMQFIDRAVRLCFWNAHLAKEEAEFASVQTTMEGGKVAFIYRLASDGTVEVLTDFTQDAMSSGDWQRSVCTKVVEGEGQSLVGFDGCGDSTTAQ